MNKKGFVSITVIYSFLILFLLLLMMILTIYINRENMVDKIVTEVKESLE